MRLLLCFCLLLTSIRGLAKEPYAIYASWIEDPATTMVIRWITDEAALGQAFLFKEEGAEEWQKATVERSPFPEGRPYSICSASLKGLRPDQVHLFQLEGEAECYRFQTMPALFKEPISFAVGGDTMRKDVQDFSTTCRQAAKQNPRFCVLGGDLAYAADAFGLQKEHFTFWFDWIQVWSDTMRTHQNQLIPLIAVIGNHDVKRRYNQTPKEAPVFHALFPLPEGKTYRTLDFGSYLSLFLLDSGHCHPITGRQQKWLKRSLLERMGQKTRIPIYHIPAYPCVRDFKTLHSALIRKHWVPLFESGQVHAAFEHHDHAYKRTYPLLQGTVDEKGVVYFGDGAWGVEARDPKTPEELWYLASSAGKNHFILVTLLETGRLYQTISAQGEVIDQYIQEE
ncbi:MAG: conserved putative secreted protein [Chlamydiales bacterium]|jgi:hypothetical protein|nr:conserved putative secreted protein [Chlamydiales bacterium]